MKNLLLTISMLFFTFSISFAQNSVAYIDGTKKGVEAKTTITIEFKVSNISTEKELEKMTSLFSASNGVNKVVSSSFNGNEGYFTIAVLKNNFCKNCQNMFLAAEIESIKVSEIDNYDVIKTNDVEGICKRVAGKQSVAPER